MRILSRKFSMHNDSGIRIHPEKFNDPGLRYVWQRTSTHKVTFLTEWKSWWTQFTLRSWVVLLLCVCRLLQFWPTTFVGWKHYSTVLKYNRILQPRMLNPAGFLLWGLKPSTVNILFYCWVFTRYLFVEYWVLSGVTRFYIPDYNQQPTNN